MYKKKVVVEKTLSLREKKGVVVCERETDSGIVQRDNHTNQAIAARSDSSNWE
jgi:hypothetical protein